MKRRTPRSLPALLLACNRDPEAPKNRGRSGSRSRYDRQAPFTYGSEKESGSMTSPRNQSERRQDSSVQMIQVEAVAQGSGEARRPALGRPEGPPDDPASAAFLRLGNAGRGRSRQGPDWETQNLCSRPW